MLLTSGAPRNISVDFQAPLIYSDSAIGNASGADSSPGKQQLCVTMSALVFITLFYISITLRHSGTTRQMRRISTISLRCVAPAFSTVEGVQGVVCQSCFMLPLLPPKTREEQEEKQTEDFKLAV